MIGWLTCLNRFPSRSGSASTRRPVPSGAPSTRPWLTRGAAFRCGWILLDLTHGRPGTQRDLAEAVGIREATLTHHLNAMDADGLITRTRDAANRRIQVVTLTDEGNQAFLRLRAAAVAFDAKLRTGLGRRRRSHPGRTPHAPVSQRRRPRRDTPALGRPVPPPLAAHAGEVSGGTRGSEGPWQARARGEQREVARGDDRGQGDRGRRAGDGRGGVDAQQHLLQVGVRGGRHLAHHVRRPGDRVAPRAPRGSPRGPPAPPRARPGRSTA